MAFNFNWSPLIADTSRARDMLTAALNKSPKPPIIVDDILVNELNLGSVPPELDILEIGDLAEDRFRGIFKMTYAGDAFLTLKTRVQANPLNTYLSTKPSFASPQPLAAASGLTIPLQITLSDIRLSGFVILVFSRQKGITLVFRNDPLESLKVSSTFDSIPFVRDYLQKEIEGQLRVLFMEDLPAIIHRLSLRLWVPEYADREDGESNIRDDHRYTRTSFPGPHKNSVVDIGNSISASDMSPFFWDQGAEASSTYSQRISLRLAALTDSYRTLSLFTPPIGDTVFRAWAGAAEHLEPGLVPVTSFNLSNLGRKHSSNASFSSLHSFSDAGGESRQHSFSSRPTFSNVGGMSMGSNKSRAHGKKRKKRVVNLRQSNTGEDINATESRPSTPTSTSYASHSAATSEVREGELITPPESPEKILENNKAYQTIESRIDTSLPTSDLFSTPRPRAVLDKICQDSIPAQSSENISSSLEQSDWTPKPKLRQSQQEKVLQHLPLIEHRRISNQRTSQPPQSGRILEQAWMAKMATEIARAAEAQKSSSTGLWNPDDRDDTPPPAYAA